MFSLAAEHNKDEVLEGKFRNLNFSAFTKNTTDYCFELFFLFIDISSFFLSDNRFARKAYVFKETSFSKATVVMRFPTKKNTGCPKAPRDFPLKKDGILHSPSGCLGTSLPLPQSLYGWALRCDLCRTQAGLAQWLRRAVSQSLGPFQIIIKRSAVL